MVTVRLLIISWACLFASSAVAVTADELRGAAADKDRETTQRQNRVNSGSLADLLPAENTLKSSKYDTPAASSSAPTTTHKKHLAKKASGIATATSGVSEIPVLNTYTPPERSSAVPSGPAIVTDAVQSTVSFGIRLGSWLNATLDRNTTSAETGSVELTLKSNFVGDRRTLPAGTTLFADKNLNNATKRMELVVTHGITPTGVEFEMRGLVFDPMKTPGLAGVYMIDKKEMVTHGVSKGAIAAVGAAVGMASPGVGTTAANAATLSVLNDANQVTDSNAQQAIIYVSPQALIIRVEKQF